MWYILIGFSIIGIIVGITFTFFLINFDGKWKVVLEAIISIGGSGIGIASMCDFYVIDNQIQKLVATIGLGIGFIGSTVVLLIIMCYMIKDKDDADVLRIRDILLGQKSYIEKYYKQRMDEIDQKLGIPKLTERENKVAQRENSIAEKERFIEDQLQDINALGKSKLRINIPFENKIVLTKDLLDSMPEYIYGLAKFIGDLKEETDLQNGNINTLNEFIAYLYSILTYVMKDVFETNSENIRVHFRFYNQEENKYKKLVAISGKRIIAKDMTPIPYENSLIKKSYECKRALIKSANSDYDYQSNNYTVWQDYMTYSFYNISKNDMPLLTFGISVKNKTVYKNKFYFLNYFKIEQYLEDAIDSINESCLIENILYEKEVG